MISWMSLLLHNTEQINGKCTEDGSAVMGRAIPHVIICHLYPFAQPVISAKPSWPKGQKHMVLNRERTVCEQPPIISSLSVGETLISYNFSMPETGTVWKTLTKRRERWTTWEEGSHVPGYSVSATKLASSKQWFRESPEVKSHLIRAHI